MKTFVKPCCLPWTEKQWMMRQLPNLTNTTEAFRIRYQPTASSTQKTVWSEQDVDKAKEYVRGSRCEWSETETGLHLQWCRTVRTGTCWFQEQLREVGVTVELAGGSGTAIANAMKDQMAFDNIWAVILWVLTRIRFSTCLKMMVLTTTCTTVDTIPSIQLFEGRWIGWVCKKETMQNCRQLSRCFLSDHFQQQDPGCKQQNPGCGRCGTCSGIYASRILPVWKLLNK